jgi:subtilisin family serine protease
MRERGAPHGRRRWIAAVAALFASTVSLTAAPAKATGVTGDPGAESLLVRFRPAVADAAARAALDRAGAEVGEEVGQTGFVEISTDGQPADEVRRRLLASGLVDTVEPNLKRTSLAVPSDPLYSGYQAAYLSAVGLPRAWDMTTGSDNLVLAVIDSGVDIDHPDLAGRLLAGKSFVTGVSGYGDDEGHGTMVAGVAAARTDNRMGVAGATWRGRILPVKVLDASGTAHDDDIIRGIDWAVAQGADVINLSLGGPGFSDALCRSVANAVASNVVVVAAAGNLARDDKVEPHYPAACGGAIAVGATDAENNLAPFSNRGAPGDPPWIDLVAPGVDLVSTAFANGPAEGYAQKVSGTSFSAPLVAGAAVLMRAADPAASAATIAERLRRSARDLGAPGLDLTFGAGLLDVAAALRLSSAAGSPGGIGTQVRSGYWTVSADGRVYDFGDASLLGDASGLLQQPAADIEPAPGGAGYWIVDRHGAVFGFGTAAYHGGLSAAHLRPGETVTSLSSTPGGLGYWLFTTTGRVFAFGNAQSYGDLAATTLNAPVLDSVPTPTGNGYYMVGADGGIFTFGDAHFAGSTGGLRLNAPVQSLVPDPDGGGYWLVAADGGVFAFDAGFRGSLGGTPLNKPVTGMVAFGDGYLMVGEDGGIFNFSNLPFSGSLGGVALPSPVVAVASLPR